MHMDMMDKRITLTQRGASARSESSAERTRTDAPAGGDASQRRTATLGDLIKEKLGDQVDNLPTGPKS